MAMRYLADRCRPECPVSMLFAQYSDDVCDYLELYVRMVLNEQTTRVERRAFVRRVPTLPDGGFLVSVAGAVRKFWLTFTGYIVCDPSDAHGYAEETARIKRRLRMMREPFVIPDVPDLADQIADSPVHPNATWSTLRDYLVSFPSDTVHGRLVARWLELSGDVLVDNSAALNTLVGCIVSDIPDGESVAARARDSISEYYKVDVSSLGTDPKMEARYHECGGVPTVALGRYILGYIPVLASTAQLLALYRTSDQAYETVRLLDIWPELLDVIVALGDASLGEGFKATGAKLKTA